MFDSGIWLMLKELADSELSQAGEEASYHSASEQGIIFMQKAYWRIQALENLARRAQPNSFFCKRALCSSIPSTPGGEAGI